MTDPDLQQALEDAFAEARRRYHERGFQRRVGFGKKPAMINVDLANAWTRPGNPFTCENVDEQIIPSVRRLLDAFRRNKQLVVFATAAAVNGRVATGERAGQRVRRRLVDPPAGVRAGPLCFAARGFSLHAATRIAAENRSRLEQLCRYVMRPPLASGRLRRLDADTLTYTLKTPWADGTTLLVLSPLELIEKLAALVPLPRLNLIRYHGVLAPNAAARAAIVPGPQAEADETTCSGRHSGQGETPTYRRSWATLLARVFRIDVTRCPDCGGRMKIIAALTDPSSIRRCLQGMRLPARAPPIAPARPDPQPQFDYA